MKKIGWKITASIGLIAFSQIALPMLNSRGVMAADNSASSRPARPGGRASGIRNGPGSGFQGARSSAAGKFFAVQSHPPSYIDSGRREACAIRDGMRAKISDR